MLQKKKKGNSDKKAHRLGKYMGSYSKNFHKLVLEEHTEAPMSKQAGRVDGQMASKRGEPCLEPGLNN